MGVDLIQGPSGDLASPKRSTWAYAILTRAHNCPDVWKISIECLGARQEELPVSYLNWESFVKATVYFQELYIF